MHPSAAQPHTTEEQRVAAVVRALRRPRYEVLPVDGVEDEIAAVVPRDLPITVTASPRHGLEPTMALTEMLCRLGHVAVPHLAARQVVDESHLGEILGRLDSAGVRDAFVIAGDCPVPRGRFADSLAMLTAMSRRTNSLERIGIAGYPDGHPLLPEAPLARALTGKAPFATYLVSQLCFDPAAVANWVSRLRAAGVTLPVYAADT
jgi:methylenetetrahydrofolate reductase (NADPH)